MRMKVTDELKIIRERVILSLCIVREKRRELG